MDVNGRPYKEVTLLVSHYNRSRSLETPVHTFRDYNIIFVNIVVSMTADE